MKKRTKQKYAVAYINRRTPTLYMVTLITVALSIFTFYMIFFDLDNFFIEYSSKLSGIFWMIYFVIFGNILLICMLWLSGRYILKIEEAEEGFVYIKTWSIIGLHRTKRYPKAITTSGTYYHGRANLPSTPVVNAPFSVLRTPSGKRLILDEAGGSIPKTI